MKTSLSFKLSTRRDNMRLCICENQWLGERWGYAIEFSLSRRHCWGSIFGIICNSKKSQFVILFFISTFTQVTIKYCTTILFPPQNEPQQTKLVTYFITLSYAKYANTAWNHGACSWRVSQVVLMPSGGVSGLNIDFNSDAFWSEAANNRILLTLSFTLYWRW